MTPDPDPDAPASDLIDSVADPQDAEQAAENIEEMGEPFVGNNA